MAIHRKMGQREISPENSPYYLAHDNGDINSNVAYLKDAYDLLDFTLQNEPQTIVQLDSLPYGCSILDYGMRTGIWSSQTADLVRELFGRVVAYDSTEIHPPLSNFPTNLSIYIGNDDDVWCKDIPYDIIHARVVESVVDWQSFPKKAYDSLHPGGRLIVEVIDLMPQSDDDGPLPADSSLEVWARIFNKYDRQRVGHEQIQDLLIAQGFDVTCAAVDLPINTHSVLEEKKETGKRFHWCLKQFLQARCFLAHSEIPPQELFDLVAKATKEIQNLNHHAFCTCYVLTAAKREDRRKPWW